MNDWYQSLIKPFWAPPSWLFGPAWTFLYLLLFISFGYVFSLFFKGKITFLTLLPFLLNIFFNIIFSPIQFGLKNNLLASIDIILLLVTLIWAMFSIFPNTKWVTFINIPYLMWVSFATVLQLTVTYLNW